MTWQASVDYEFCWRIDLVEEGKDLGYVRQINRSMYHCWLAGDIHRLPNERTLTAATRAVEMAVQARKKAV
jgi:hypothetical protein